MQTDYFLFWFSLYSFFPIPEVRSVEIFLKSFQPLTIQYINCVFIRIALLFLIVFSVKPRHTSSRCAHLSCPRQIQLIKAKNTTPTPTSPVSPTPTDPGAMTPGEEVQMTWSDDLDKNKNPSVANPETAKDMFNIKP